MQTHNQQPGKCTTGAMAGDRGAGNNKVGEEWRNILGVDVRPVMRVDCNLEGVRTWLMGVNVRNMAHGCECT